MPKTSPWNKGKSVGQKAPFSPRDVQTIKQILANAGNLRDLALFSMGIDTMLRGADLLTLKVEDVTDHTGTVVEQFAVGQQKTGKGTVVALLPYSREVLTQCHQRTTFAALLEDIQAHFETLRQHPNLVLRQMGSPFADQGPVAQPLAYAA
jgi:integrase